MNELNAVPKSHPPLPQNLKYKFYVLEMKQDLDLITGFLLEIKNGVL